MYTLWHRPVCNGSHPGRVHPDALPPYNVTKKLQVRLTELAFVHLCMQCMLPQYAEYNPEIPGMLLRASTEIQNVINVDKHNTFLENAVHEGHFIAKRRAALMGLVRMHFVIIALIWQPAKVF